LIINLVSKVIVPILNLVHEHVKLSTCHTYQYHIVWWTYYKHTTV